MELGTSTVLYAITGLGLAVALVRLVILGARVANVEMFTDAMAKALSKGGFTRAHKLSAVVPRVAYAVMVDRMIRAGQALPPGQSDGVARSAMRDAFDQEYNAQVERLKTGAIMDIVQLTLSVAPSGYALADGLLVSWWLHGLAIAGVAMWAWRQRHAGSIRGATFTKAAPIASGVLEARKSVRGLKKGSRGGPTEDITAPYPSAKGRSVLNVYRDGQPVLTYTLEAQKIAKIGKLSSSHIQLDHPSISRMHAVIEASDKGELRIVDLGSSRGTLVNGEKISTVDLEMGDTIGIGPYDIRIERSAAELTARTGNTVVTSPVQLEGEPTAIARIETLTKPKPPEPPPSPDQPATLSPVDRPDPRACLVCGHGELARFSDPAELIGELGPLDAKVCRRCGHVHLFVPDPHLLPESSE